MGNCISCQDEISLIIVKTYLNLLADLEVKLFEPELGQVTALLQRIWFMQGKKIKRTRFFLLVIYLKG